MTARVRTRQPIASEVEIRRELPRDGSYPTPIPEGAGPREEAGAWAEDARIVFEAACRAEARRRAQLIAYHRERLAELEGAA